ncbi:TonB-dependent receptor [Sandaracinobacteroides saxicola]|uniref:TonB-dependent receptor n=1 Tax=Sandaracinobacteroides saxicola TaxID=2759707 RepID=A0A7G5IFA8_9SPHN|nr:TonB-dependent receptor [Sandaracinobacteroides saxicola]QMW22050.1 TonB-dependent receptor [Sandaracinobacteroides saxicola]
MKSRLTALLIGTSLLAVAAPATAQAPAPAPAPQASADGLDDIVVTAQRREERLQNVPIAISAFTQEELTKNDVRDISRLAQFTPGFNFGQSGFDTRPAIRGVRTDSVDGNGDPTIGFYIDDVYQSLAVQASAPIVDVARVEIARGPQGTLFGRNTFGGAISIVSALPTNELEGGFDLTYGNYDRIKATGYISIPVSDSFGIRLAGSRERRDGYVINVNPVARGNDLYSRDSDFMRSTARWTPTDSLEVIVRGTYWREGGTGAGAFGYKQGGVIANPNVTPETAGVRGGRGLLTGTPLFFFAGAPRDGIPDINGVDIGSPDSPDPYSWVGEFRPSAALKQYAGSGQIRWSNDSIFVRSITSYQDFKYQSNAGEARGSPRTEYVAIRNTRTFTQELQVGSVTSKPFQWIAGLYYLDDKYYDSFYINDPGYFFQSGQTISTKSYAAYGQASLYLSDMFRITAGGRYTSDEKNFIYNELYADTISPFPSAFTNQAAFQAYRCPGASLNATCFPAAFPAKGTFKKFTWRLGAEAFLTPENLLYASVSTGFRSGGFNGASLNNPNLPAAFQPENITAYEIGSKNRFAGGTIQLNASAYYNQFRNLQLQNQFSIPGSTVSSSGVLNAGSARAYGLELEAVVRPMPELTLNATAALVNARFTDYRFRGRPSTFYPLQDINLSGNSLGHTPDYKFTAGASYDFVIPGFGTITPRASAVFSGKYFNTDYNTVIDVQRAYTTIDAGLGWKSEDQRFGLEAFVTNLTDKAVLNYAAFGSQTLLTSYEPPRFYGIRFSFKSR